MSTLTVWINAFIPKDVAGYTRSLVAGPHSGKTAIPLPGIARTWPGNTLKDWNAGYLTDQRGFSNLPGAGARMQSLAEIAVPGLFMTKQIHRSSGTTEVNLVSGAQTGFAVADMSRCSFTVVPPAPPHGPPGGFGAHLSVARGGAAFPNDVMQRPMTSTYGTLDLWLVASAGDPLVGMAADIDYYGTFNIAGGTAPGSLHVTFQGKIDDFPAYDCYASMNGVTKTIFTSDPPPGNTVADLLGPPIRSISGTVMFP